MRFLVLGTVLKPEHFQYNLAANPASSKWLMGFLQGLDDNEAELYLCGHCYSQAWPKGPLFPGNEKYLLEAYHNRLVKFLNFPGIRFRSMARAYYRVAENIAEFRSVDAVITYNPYPWHVYVARKIRQKWTIPWICLNLDFEDVGQNWENFIRDAGDADGHLFLSHWGYENAPVQRKIHLDSGVGSIPENFGASGTSDPLTITYLGKLAKSGGLDVLLQLPELIDASNVRFVYGGKGYPAANEKLKALAARDSRVEYLGFVDEEDVPRLFGEASIFLNPRDPDDVVNDMVFPSKIMQYLNSGKTIVSTWTKGLDPAYRDLMIIAEDPSCESFTKAVKLAIAESPRERADRSQRILGFLQSSRLWSQQSERFVTFAESVVSNFHSKKRLGE